MFVQQIEGDLRMTFHGLADRSGNRLPRFLAKSGLVEDEDHDALDGAHLAWTWRDAQPDSQLVGHASFETPEFSKTRRSLQSFEKQFLLVACEQKDSQIAHL